MRYTNKFGLPAPLVAVIENDPYDAGDSDISTTSLILPPRIYQLRKRHDEEIHEDIADNIYRLLGHNTHSILERVQALKCLIERRFYTDIYGWRVGGKIDLYEMLVGTLSDWKITSVYSVLGGVKPEHEQQLNVNAFLMYQNDIYPKKLQIVNFLRDWSKYQAKKHDYPDCQVVVQPIKLWSFAEQDRWLYERVKLHQECETMPDNELPPCTSQEMWTKPTVYAVKKKGRKSALRLLDTQEKAEKWIEDNKKGDSIEVRLGENMRCEHYCNINRFCSQYIGF